MGRPYKQQESMPAERAVAREKPRVHVILCRWNNGKMPEGIDIDPLVPRLQSYPGVGRLDVVFTL